MEKTQNKVFNIPNMLSMLRMALIPLFVYFYFEATDDSRINYLYAGLILIFSGVTDFVDGVIARWFNQITPLGKILDPLADKLTQLSVVICVAIKEESVWLTAVLGVFVIKEILMLIGGAIMIKNKITINGSKWYGKVATALFYVVMAAIALFDISTEVMVVMVSVVAAFMLFAFSQYIKEYFKLMKQSKNNKA